MTDLGRDEIALLAAMKDHETLMFFDRLEDLRLVKKWPSGYEITPKGKMAVLRAKAAGEIAQSIDDLPLFTGECTCDAEGCCQHPSGLDDPLATWDEQEKIDLAGRVLDTLDEKDDIEGFTHLEAMDALNDLIAGVRHWKDTKLGSDTWGPHDEALARWIEGSEIELDS